MRLMARSPGLLLVRMQRPVQRRAVLLRRALLVRVRTIEILWVHEAGLAAKHVTMWKCVVTMRKYASSVGCIKVLRRPRHGAIDVGVRLHGGFTGRTDDSLGGICRRRGGGGGVEWEGGSASG